MVPDTVAWRDDRLEILDQRALPHRVEWIEATTWQEVAAAIREMAVRGAPLIGIAAAFGYVLGDRAGEADAAAAGLASTRPTAVNLFHALHRVSRAEDPLVEAFQIKAEEERACAAIATHGSALVDRATTVLSICNTGRLATAGVGTALGVVRQLHAERKLSEAILLETRPRQQGMRLSAWELAQEGIPFRVISDGAAAWCIKTHSIGLVLSGADRIAANGDTANKIGTYALAIVARQHGVPFMVAAPSSTIDRELPSGDDIVIEERDAGELTDIEGVRIAPDPCPVWNPAFDVTPGDLVSVIVTELGVWRPPFQF